MRWLCSRNRQGRSRHIPDRRYSILMPVPIVPAVQSLRFVQDVELGDATWPKLALLYWICRGKHNYRGRTTPRVRGRIKAVVVIRERETCSLPEEYRDRGPWSWGNFHVLIILKTSK